MIAPALQHQRHRWRAICGGAVVLVLTSAGCTASVTGPSTSSASATPAGSASGTASLGSSASAAPSDAAPAELQGYWVGRVAGDQVILAFGTTGYSVQRGPESVGGRISVSGAEITFSNSTSCDGVGHYTWAVTDGRLRFTEIEPDPCGGRREILVGHSYRRP